MDVEKFVTEAIKHGTLGKTKQAILFLKKALSQTSDQDEIVHICATLNNLGGYNLLNNHFRDAVLYLQMALKPTQQLNMPDKMALLFTNLGVAYRNLEELHKATLFFKGAYKIARRIGDHNMEAIALAQLGLMPVSEEQSASITLSLLDEAWLRRQFLDSDIQYKIIIARAHLLCVSSATNFVIKLLLRTP